MKWPKTINHYSLFWINTKQDSTKCTLFGAIYDIWKPNYFYSLIERKEDLLWTCRIKIHYVLSARILRVEGETLVDEWDKEIRAERGKTGGKMRFGDKGPRKTINLSEGEREQWTANWTSPERLLLCVCECVRACACGCLFRELQSGWQHVERVCMILVSEQMFVLVLRIEPRTFKWAVSYQINANEDLTFAHVFIKLKNQRYLYETFTCGSKYVLTQFNI